MSLTRRTPLRSRPKGKGNQGEREIVDMCREYGWPHARRNFASGGQGGADIINGPPGVSLEVKRCETAKIWSWIAQAEEAAMATDIPTVVFRRNRGDWWACAPSDEWEALEQLVGGPPKFTVVRERERVDLWKWLDVATEGAQVLPGVPRVRFKRESSDWYTVGPAREFFDLLRLREQS